MPDSTTPPRICHLGKFYPPASGGIETHLRALATSQARLGATVRVIVVNHLDRHGRDVTWKTIASTPTDIATIEGVEVVRLGRIASVARLDVCPGIAKALRQAKRDRFDLLHVHNPNPTMLLALTALKPPMPIVLTHHADVVKQKYLRHILGVFENRVCASASLVLSDSPTYIPGSSLLQRHIRKVESLPLGIDLQPYLHPSAEALAEAERLRRDLPGPLWLGVGRLIYYKGFDVALKALRNVPGTLTIVGTGPLEKPLRQQARDLGVEARVIFRGYTRPDELVGAYLASTAFWFPSVARSEGFGLVQVEAMASGCPPINTDIPHSGVSWVSPHERTGLTVPVGDADAFAAAANRLVADLALRERLSDAGRQRAIDEFDRTLMAARSLELYRSHVLAPDPRSV